MWGGEVGGAVGKADLEKDWYVHSHTTRRSIRFVFVGHLSISMVNLSPLASWRSNNAHAAEEMGVFLAGPDPFVEEHPAGAPPGTVPEGDHRDFAAFTQPL